MHSNPGPTASTLERCTSDMPATPESDHIREHIVDQLQQFVDTPAQGSSRIACAVIHVRNTRHVRALLGREGASEFMRLLREKLEALVQASGYVSAYSYDHFIVALPRILNTGHAKLAAQKIELLLRNPVAIASQLVEPDFSLGMALLPDHAEDGAQLMTRAEMALLAAEDGGLGHRLFDDELLDELTYSWQFDHELRDAIRGNELATHYQPQVGLMDGRVHGVEALARWEHPVKGFVSPTDFIPAAERAGMIPMLTDAVLKQVMQDFAALKALGVDSVSINLSALDLEDPELAARIEQQFAIWAVPGMSVTFEITESCILQGTEVTRQQLDKLSQLGCDLSIDDFGTGYSSLANFKTVPANEIKIDASFVEDLDTDATNRDIVAIALELGRRFGLRTVAEGVETDAAAAALREMGCELGQGYFYARPLPLHQLRAWCRDRSNEGRPPG